MTTSVVRSVEIDMASVGTQTAFFARDWKPFQRNTLKGFLTLVLPSGLVIKECSLHERGGQKWIGMPSRSYTTKDGQIAYANILDFDSKGAQSRFQELALAAVADLLAEVCHE